MKVEDDMISLSYEYIICKILILIHNRIQFNSAMMNGSCLELS